MKPGLRVAPALLAATAMLVGACSSSVPAPDDGGGAFPMQFGNCEADVTVEQRPERIVTNGVVPIDLLHAAGAADRIVARTGEQGQTVPDPARQAVAAVPELTPDRPTTEIVASSGADFMYAEDLGGVTSREQLAGVGITTVIPCGDNDESTTFDDVYVDLALLGRLMGTEPVAEAAVADLRGRVEAATERASAVPPRTAAGVSVYENTLYFDGRVSMLHTIMTTANLQNVFADSTEFNFEAGPENLIARDPAVIVLGYGSYGDTFESARAAFLATPGVADMTAVRTGAIVGVPFTDSYASTRAVNGLETLTDQLDRLP